MPECVMKSINVLGNTLITDEFNISGHSTLVNYQHANRDHDAAAGQTSNEEAG